MKIDLEKFICSLLQSTIDLNTKRIIYDALKEQSLDYNNGSIIESNTKEYPKFKFKKGQWIVSNTYKSNILHIIDVDNSNYEVETPSGNTGTPSIAYVDNNFYLWTTQDINDGDILTCYCESREQVGIMKKYIGRKGGCPHVFECYAYVDYDGQLHTGNTGMGSEKIEPATKEQRDFLFQKMKESGYEWDAEKKELKEIEPAEWSEECCINQLIVFCENCMVQDTNAKRCANFLKSLKERYTWKPSDEQMKNLSRAVNGGSYRTSLLMELYQDLKKLKG